MKTWSIQELTTNRTAELIEQLTTIWDSSVRTTHGFLTEQDIVQIRPYVSSALQEVPHLILLYQGEIPMGFMGIQGEKIEMLFLSPACMGKGWGSRLVDHAVQHYGVILVDVNEQNETAALFYQHKGFRVVRRDAYDEQGNPFPILHLSR